MKNVYKPVFYRPDSDADNSAFYTLFNSPTCFNYDTIRTQIVELLACRNPSLPKQEILNQNMVEDHLATSKQSIENYGVWVHYPWKNQLVHILDEEEFIEVRTNRNKYKITQEEQDLLRTKKVGIIGLSVGRAVATTIALERIAGEIRLADFDDIELSNLNRIKTPLIELGKNKAISAAQEIAEIDPYLNVICYCDGYTDENAEDFFNLGGKMDLLVEECDDIRTKVESRLMARKLQIPVVMETNDNCIIDIERFDLEQDRELFHGKLGDDLIDKIVNGNVEINKVEVVSKIVDFDKISPRMKMSLNSINKEIRSWPQVASEVIYGAGRVSEIVKEILLKSSTTSGQFTYSNVYA